MILGGPWFAYLSPAGRGSGPPSRGRPPGGVRAPSVQSSRSVLSIISRTPSRLSYTSVLERFRAKWTPVRVKKTRQITNLELRFDSIETEKALETRTMWKPQASNTSDLALSRASSACSVCVTPSTSTISFPSKVTKSTTYRSIECWRRNLHRASRRLRSACQSFASALVCDKRRFRALALNLSIPLTRLLRSRPLPNGERYSTANAAP